MSSSALAQIRMVTYNIEADIGGFTTTRPGFDTVVQAIGTESVNGFARPIDIMTLQETTSNATTIAPIVTSLNNFYGAGTYAQSPYQATQNGSNGSGNGPNGLVYNTHTLTLIASVGFYTPSSSGPPRQAVRYQFRPVGYGASADFYVYNSHYKSAADSTSEDRRNQESIQLRTNANTLPAGSRIIYTGDFNPFKGSLEPAWITLVGTGSFGTNARAIDPINLGNGTWDGDIGTMSFAYTDASDALHYRDDMQLQTAPTNDAHGFSYISGSHHTFGNNGTTPLGAGANSGSNTALAGMPNRTTVLSSLTTASDHYPVVADYRLPAKMSASVGSVPAQVIVGAAAVAPVTVSNVAPVAVAAGADTLDYTVTGSGSLSGSINSSDAALGGTNLHNLSFNTATPGLKTGTVNVSSSSQEVEAGTFVQSVSTTVLAHSKPSFTTPAQQTSGAIDLGVRGWNLDAGTQLYRIYNLSDISGFTAALDLDSFSGAGDTSRLTSGLSTFVNLPGGGSASFTATMNTDTLGLFSASYTINLSDQDLAGATSSILTLNLIGRVAIPGDTDFNGVVDFDDYVMTDTGYNTGLSGWSNGDFTGDGVVDFDDFVLIDFYYNNQGGGLMTGLNWLEGEDRNQTITPQLRKIIDHFGEFGVPYAQAFYAMVPEPTAVASTLFLAAIPVSRRRRRNHHRDAASMR